MEILALILSALSVVLSAAVLVSLRRGGANDRLEQRLSELQEQSDKSQSRLRTEISTGVTGSVARLGDSMREEMYRQRKTVDERLTQVNAELERMRESTVNTLERLRAENRESLDKINGTVNEKLQKTLDDRISKSFESVSRRLAEVYEGLGEMKNVASGVADLRKVLANVKTRGIMGELQLSAILAEILSPEQYCEQAQVRAGSRERVDFAVRLPGGESEVLLPIDAKFPGDRYADLADAYESGDSERIKACRALLETELRRCAASIRDKYIEPPQTTDFAIMFLPFEGLYAEAVNMGLVERLQRECRVSIAGPSTMAAMLNSLQMGFRTLAIQKKSGEVWRILETAKKEFAAFETVLDKTRERLRQADDELEKLVGVRTRAINRGLRDVQTLTTDDKFNTEG